MAILSEHHGSVVVGVDGSPPMSHAIRWAAEEATMRKVPLTLVHMLPDSVSETERASRTQSERWLHEASVTARAVSRGLSPRIELRTEDVVPGLVGMSADAAMIVLGASGPEGATHVPAGSTANSVVGGARCPVVVVRTPPLEPSGAGRPVVVGVDGSPASAAAVRFAFEEASIRGCALIALHTWTDAYLGSVSNVDRSAFDRTDLEQREEELLTRQVAGWQEKYPDVRVTRVVKRDWPVRTLLDYDREAQLLVVGSRGLGAYHGMLLGSTSQALILHAQLPLVVVRPEDPA